MNILQAFKGGLEKARKMLPQRAPYRDYEFQYGGDTNQDKHIPRLSRISSPDQLYSQVKSWVFNAVCLRCEDVAKTKFRLYTTKVVKGIETIEEIYDHPIISLMLQPNPYFTWYDLLYITVQNMDIQGSFFWLKERDKLNVLRQIRPVFPKYIQIIPDEFNYVKCYRYRDHAAAFDINPKDIIHFKHPKPGDIYQGQSILMAIADVININNSELQYQLESFNQPIPSVSLETDKDLGLQIARELQSEFQEKYGGIRKISRVPVLDNGLKLNIHKRSAHELDFSQSRKQLRDEILSAFRVPANKLGIVTDVNKANADAADYSYLANAIEPLCRYISIKLTQDFRQEFQSPKLLIQHDDVVPQDVEKKLRYYESGLKYKWLTVDEVRRMENFDSLSVGR